MNEPVVELFSIYSKGAREGDTYIKYVGRSSQLHPLEEVALIPDILASLE